MNTNPTTPTPKQTIQEASVVASFAPDLSRSEMLRAVSHIDIACFPRIREIVAIALFPTYKGEIKATIYYHVECPRTEDCRPILEACFSEETQKPEIRGMITGYRAMGATRL